MKWISTNDYLPEEPHSDEVDENGFWKKPNTNTVLVFRKLDHEDLDFPGHSITTSNIQYVRNHPQEFSYWSYIDDLPE